MERLSGHCREIILAVGTSFSDSFSCGEVAVLKRLKLESEYMKYPPRPEKEAVSGDSTELYEEPLH